MKSRLISLHEWLQEIPPNQSWVVDNLVPYEGITLISGQPKLAKKSFFAMLLALVVATGRTLQGVKPATPEPLPVIYYAEEDSHFDNKMRWEALIRSVGLKAAPENLYWVFRQRIRLDEEEEYDRLKKDVTQAQPHLIILDTLKNMNSADENNSKEMGMVTDLAQDLSLIEPYPAVCILHHLKRSASPKEDIDQRVRGSGDLLGKYACHIGLWGSRENPDVDGVIRSKNDEDHPIKVTWEFANKQFEDKYFTDIARPNVVWKLTRSAELEEAKQRLEKLENIIAGLKPDKDYKVIDLVKLWGLDDIEDVIEQAGELKLAGLCTFTRNVLKVKPKK